MYIIFAHIMYVYYICVYYRCKYESLITKLMVAQVLPIDDFIISLSFAITSTLPIYFTSQCFKPFT